MEHISRPATTMRIAHLGSKGLPSKSGTERVVEAIVEQLAEGHNITVYCDSRYTPRGTEVPGVRLVRIPTLPGKYTQATSLFILSALHAVFLGRYDLIHVHSVEACFVLPLLRLRYRVIATSHGSASKTIFSKWGTIARFLIGLTEYPFIHLANCATSVSHPDTKYLHQRHGRKVLWIPNGVAPHLNQDPQACASVALELGLKPKQYILFAAGRILPMKGCHFVLEAYLGSDLDLPLVIVGDSGHMPDYTRRLRERANERVLFVPSLEKERLFAVVSSCSLFVFPSMTEGMSLMLLEVATLGIPLLCSDIAENQTVLGDRTLYFHSEDVDDLRRQLVWALQNPDTMAALAANAQSWVRQTYSWDVIARQYEQLYSQCSSRKGKADRRV